MKIRYRIFAGIVGFLLVLLISLAGQLSWGSDLIVKIPGDPPSYTCNGKKYVVRVLPIEPIHNLKNSILVTQQKSLLERTGIPALQSYVFVPADNPLEADFTVKSYYPIKNFKADDCLAPNAAYVGANIFVEYKAGSVLFRNDPATSLHWIQIVKDTVENNGTPPLSPPLDKPHPPGEYFLDIGNDSFIYALANELGYHIVHYPNTPYYPNLSCDPGDPLVCVGHIFMSDVPKRSATVSHTWKAQLYLAKEINGAVERPPGLPLTTTPVRIYDGIEWGYEVSESVETDAPCNSPDKLAISFSQSKSENKQDKSCKATAHSTNDPHLVTFDGLKYDLQTVGEVILIKSNNSAFEVQARQTPWNNSASVSINSAVAMKVGSDRVAIYAQGLPDADTTTPLRVNGKPTTIQGDKLALQGGGEILKQGSTYVVSAPTGEKVLVSPSSSFLNISPIVDNRSGKYSGLLGNVNGNPNDDLQIRGGGNVLEVRSTYGDVKKVLNLVGLRAPGALDRAEQVYFDQLYKQFANSWRVKQEESLFDYPAGKNTQSYVNPGFPDKYLTLNMLSADQIQKAQNACTEAKVTQDLMEGCIFDVGFSGFSEFARTTAEINSYVGIVNQLFPSLKIPTPEQVFDQPRRRIPRCLPLVGCH